MNRLKIEEIKRRRHDERQLKAIAHEVRSPLERPITYILNKQNRLMQHENHHDADVRSKPDRVSLSILPTGHKASKLVQNANEHLSSTIYPSNPFAHHPRHHRQLNISTSASSTAQVSRERAIFEAVEVISEWLTAEPAFIDPQTAYGDKNLRFMDCVTKRLRVFKAKIDSKVVDILKNARDDCQRTPNVGCAGDCETNKNGNVHSAKKNDSSLGGLSSRLSVKTPLLGQETRPSGALNGFIATNPITPCACPGSQTTDTVVVVDRPALITSGFDFSRLPMPSDHLLSHQKSKPPRPGRLIETGTTTTSSTTGRCDDMLHFRHSRTMLPASPASLHHDALLRYRRPEPPQLDNDRLVHSLEQLQRHPDPPLLPLTPRDDLESSFTGMDLLHPIWDTPEELKTSCSKFLLLK